MQIDLTEIKNKQCKKGCENCPFDGNLCNFEFRVRHQDTRVLNAAIRKWNKMKSRKVEIIGEMPYMKKG